MQVNVCTNLDLFARAPGQNHEASVSCSPMTLHWIALHCILSVSWPSQVQCPTVQSPTENSVQPNPMGSRTIRFCTVLASEMVAEPYGPVRFHLEAWQQNHTVLYGSSQGHGSRTVEPYAL